MSWLLTEIETDQINGGGTTTTDTPSTGSASTTVGGKTTTTTTTRTPGAGTRESSNAVDTPASAIQKSHYAMHVKIRVPVHNKQPINSGA